MQFKELHRAPPNFTILVSLEAFAANPDRRVDFTTPRSLARSTIDGGCRFLNLCWFRNINQSLTQASRRCLCVFSTRIEAPRIILDVTRHHHRPVPRWVTWLGTTNSILLSAGTWGKDEHGFGFNFLMDLDIMVSV